MAGIFGSYSAGSPGGIIGLLMGAQQQQQQQQPIAPIQQEPVLPGAMMPGSQSPLSAGLHNLGYGIRNYGIIPGLADAATGFSTGTSTDPARAQMQLMGAAIQSLPQNMPLAQKLALIQNQKLQEQRYGLQSLGSYKTPGGYEGQIVNNAGNVAPVFPTPNGQPPADLSVRTAKPGEALVDLSGGNGQQPGMQTGSALPQQGTQQAPSQSSWQPGAQQGAVYRNTTGLYDNATLDALATRYVKTGDPSILQNAGMGELGQINRAEVLKRVTAIAQKMGIPPEQISARTAEFAGLKSANETLGQVQGRMAPAIVETQNFIPLVRQAAAEFKNTNFPSYNVALQAYKTQTGDPKVVALGSYINSLRNAFSRAISTNPRGPTDADKARFDEVMSKYWSPSQIEAGFQTMNNEMLQASRSPEIAKTELGVRYGAGKIAPPDVISAAQTAIKQGANREAVILRLQQNGYGADGL